MKPSLRAGVAIALTAGMLFVLGLGYAQKSPCRNHPWAVHYHDPTGNAYADERLCYTDTFRLYRSEGLAAGSVPYLQHPVEYPVLIGAAMELASLAAARAPADRRNVVFYDITCLMLAIAAIAALLATIPCANRIQDVAFFALSPVLALMAFINWDLLAVAFTAFALLAWNRGRPVWTGIWLGLGIATKLYPIVLLVPLAAFCWRTRRLRDFSRAAAAATCAWCAVSLPVWFAAPTNFLFFYRLNSRRGATYSTSWYALERLLHHTFSVRTVDVLSGFSFAILLSVVVLIALRAPRAPSFASLSFLAVSAFLLTNKVYSPQYALWLFPLSILAQPGVLAQIVFQAAQVFSYVLTFFYWLRIDGSAAGIGYAPFGASVVLRDAALLFAAGIVVRHITAAAQIEFEVPVGVKPPPPRLEGQSLG